MSTVVIQYRIKGERTEEPVHTFEINSSSNDGDSGVSLRDMKRRVTEDNSITKWLIPSMRVFNQSGEQPESGMVGPGEIYTVVLEAGSPELEGALPCFTSAEVGEVHVPRLEDPKDGLFLNSLIRHTLDDAEKWYADMEELDSIRVTLDSLIHGLCTLAKVTDNIRVLIGEGDTEFVPLLCRGFRFISDAFLSASEQQKPTISDIFMRYLRLFPVLTPTQLAWAEPGPDIKERFDPVFSTVIKLILVQEENSFFGSVLDVIKLLGKESCTKGDLKVVKECMWTLGALADRNMAVLEALGSDKGRPLFEAFKSLLSDSRGSTSADGDIKGMLFEMKQNLVQLIMLGSEYSMTFSKRADEFGMFAAVREAIFWTVEAFSSPVSNSADPNCDNEGYIIEVIEKARGCGGGPCDDKEEREAEISSNELRKLINTVKFISFRDTPRSRAFTSFLMAELFDPAKMPSKVKSIIEESPGLQYAFLDMLIGYIEDGKPQRANNVFTQEFLHTLFSPFFMQIGSEVDEKTGETFLSTKRRFVRLRQKTCEFILLASYMTKEARNLVLADLHKIAAETKVADLFVIPSEIMTSMFSRFACSEEIQALKSEDIFELINIVLPIYRENARRKGAILGNTPFKCVQMRYESSRCILMNSCFLLLKNPVMLPKIIENEDIINFFFDMLRDTGTQTFSLSCIGKLLSAPMESCEQAMTRKNVCEKFLVCVKTFIRENTLDEFEMELQLLRAIGEVCLAGKKYQRLMITSGVFSVITSLLVLPIEGHQERKDKLVEECLGALYYVLIGCEKNKNSFKKSVGYNSFTDTLKRVVGSVTDQRIVTNKLFDMLVETRIKWGTEGSGDVIPTIRNPQVLFVILDLCGSLKTDVAAHALTRVIEVLGSMPNRNICCKNGILAHLLNMIDYYSSCSEQAESAMVGKEISFSMRINTLAIEIIHILGSHTLRAGELKHIIRILSFSGPSKTRLPDFPYLIYALHQMPSSISSPETYFGFNGISSVHLYYFIFIYIIYIY